MKTKKKKYENGPALEYTNWDYRKVDPQWIEKQIKNLPPIKSWRMLLMKIAVLIDKADSMIAEIEEKSVVKKLVTEVYYWQKRCQEMEAAFSSYTKAHKSEQNHPGLDTSPKKRCLFCKKILKKNSTGRQWALRKFCDTKCSSKYNKGRGIAWTMTEDNILKQHYILKGAKYIHLIMPHKTVDAIRARAKKLGLQTKDWLEVRRNKKKLLVFDEMDDVEAQRRAIEEIRNAKIEDFSKVSKPRGNGTPTQVHVARV